MSTIIRLDGIITYYSSYLAYCFSMHETTGQILISVVFGGDLRLEYLSCDIHRAVRTKNKFESDRMRTKYHRPARYGGINEYNMVGTSLKLQSLWERSYSVIKRINDGVHDIKKQPQASRSIRSSGSSPKNGN